MPKIIEERSEEEVEEYYLEFEYKDCLGAGFSFPCSKDGKVDIMDLNEDARKNYAACQNGCARNQKVINKDVRTYNYRIKNPRVIECPKCHEHVSMDHYFTNTCDCGANFDGSGNLLAPREQWGEETGEHWTDIINIG